MTIENNQVGEDAVQENESIQDILMRGAKEVEWKGEQDVAGIKDHWFREINDMWPGQAMNLKVQKVLYQGRSKYQDILIFESTHYGNVLVLDGVVQCTERDEMAYQEMITHLPMYSHPNPQNVLVVGGGDGGVLREVLKHPSVKQVTLCEIDEDVITLSKKYLPEMAKGYDDPRVNVFVGDGLEYLKSHQGEFDVIVTDSSDPVGPAETLFQESYFSLLRKALRDDDGIVCSQVECIWLHTALIKRVLTGGRKAGFESVNYAYCSIPTYPCGTIGFMICSPQKGRKLQEPLREATMKEEENMRYYSSQLHRASFCLPSFVRRVLKPVLEN